MKIGIDLDGPLYPFEYCFWDGVVKLGLKSGEMPKTKTWNFFTEPGYDESLEWYLDACHKLSESGHLFMSQKPHRGAVEGMKRIKEMGHSIHIMTFRMFPGAVNNTEQWLMKHEVPFDSLSFTKDKTIVPVHFMIEDNVDNAIALRESGAIPVVVDRAWNQEWDGIRVGDKEDPENADEWQEFTDMINYASQWEF